MILVIGSGVAGLSCALAAARAGAEVELVTPGELRTEARGGDACGDAGSGGGNTALAQGGIAAAIGAGDRASEHLADTVAAGAGLVDADSARVLTREGARLVRDLLASGFPADRGLDGRLALGLEGAHGRNRIVHAGGDRTGAVLHRFLAGRVLAEAAAGRIVLTERRAAVSLVSDSGLVVGAVLQDLDGRSETRHADAVVLATGGYAALYPRTSNHAGSRGEGILIAARAGALVADLEFVQFHPTLLDGTGQLISEAVRGAGALLLDGAGRRFMRDRHPLAELAPRDVVSREIHRVMRDRGESAVWLDASGIERTGGAGALARKFPGVSAAVASRGLDWTRDPIPVSPAAHYTMGGVLSDLDGRSSLPGLFVAGEVAATGVHGANRLASNSLLEGLVFGERAGRAAAAFVGADGASASGAASISSGPRRSWRTRGTGFRALEHRAATALIASAGGGPGHVDDPATVDERVSRAVAEGLGIERDAEGLRAAGAVFSSSTGGASDLAAMILAAAEARVESRGAHQRSDHPGTDEAQAHRRAFGFSFSMKPDPGFGPRDDRAGSFARSRGAIRSGSDAPLPSESRSEQRSLSPC